jgi:hypothetical protein
MIRSAGVLAISASLVLAGCDSTENGGADMTVVTTGGVSGAIMAGDFAMLNLGARIAWPLGTEVRSVFTSEEGNLADVRSYVACPAGVDPCDPNTVPGGTVYTYIHVVTPGEDYDAGKGEVRGAGISRVKMANAFLMTQPAYGFTGSVGYSRAEAAAALGDPGYVVITCDEGAIVWTVDSGGGGGRWEHMEPVTFYWQSKLPPAGSAQAYQIRADYTAADGRAPYPKIDRDAPNACHHPVPPKS